jgi:hypothetical protein
MKTRHLWISPKGQAFVLKRRHRLLLWLFGAWGTFKERVTREWF